MLGVIMIVSITLIIIFNSKKVPSQMTYAPNENLPDKKDVFDVFSDMINSLKKT
ncbi:MAG: hypothetical protein IT243_06075 [Bacteroidia bacterium]|nr:hypothetical protein [Bacteroidia bacterium]